ncbi:MAG TPA: hypothetical protein VI485_13050 [Vicinamibacterales bacterium]|nr:hypothetical protein [Vicinamibacterales bacterium]
MRLGLVAAVLVAALVSLYLFTDVFGERDPAPLESTLAPEPPTDTPQPAAAENPAATRWSIDDLGAPDDPLPAPLPLPAIEAEDTLARQVLAGDSASLPALITALQSSGIGIIGPGDSEVVKPTEPWQGMTMRRWEVRTSAAMVLPERTVTFTLADLTGVLVAAVPQLKGAAVEQLIVQDIRALADSPVPTKRFFGRFIAALGRNATGHPPYDLLGTDLPGTVDPQTIRVDGLQASLIFRRLATDVLMLTADPKAKSDKKRASLFDTLDEWVSPPVYAQGSPCRPSDSTQTIMDAAAFGTSIAWGGFEVGEMGMPGIMQRLGLSNLGSMAAIASTLLAYAQFMATYAALEAEVTLDAPPLVRTKKRAPQTGERRQLTAIVKMNIGNAEMLNCFRAMLIAVGMDFSLPNDGPVKGAHVLWYGVEGFDQAAAALHGGSEAIVQFVAPEESRIQGGGSSSASPVTNAVTGDDGKVQIGVEGIGQRDNLSDDATAVNKSAKVRLQIALKGADLFGDLQEAAGTAAGGLVGLATLPLSILQRAQWASAGHYTFPVRDWRDGPAEWTGTVTYTKVTEWSTTQAGEAMHQEQEYSEKLTLTVNINETLEGSGAFGNAGAAMKGAANANYTLRNMRSGGRLNRCSGVVTEMKSMQLDTGEGSGAGPARASVGISADGQCSITVYPEVSLTTRTSYTVQTMGYGKLCKIETQSRSTPGGVGTSQVTLDIQGDGKIDPSKPDKLSGTTEEREREGRTIKTLTWNLERK